MTGDASGLAAQRVGRAPNPEDYVVLPERISKEPLAPVVRHGDEEWHDIVTWVNTAEREKQVCDMIKQVFGDEILNGAERQEEIAKTSAVATQRQAAAAERANETAEKALLVAEASMLWTKVAGIVAVLAFLLGVIGLLK